MNPAPDCAKRKETGLRNAEPELLGKIQSYFFPIIRSKHSEQSMDSIGLSTTFVKVKPQKISKNLSQESRKSTCDSDEFMVK